jgi:hypothetical protein
MIPKPIPVNRPFDAFVASQFILQTMRQFVPGGPYDLFKAPPAKPFDGHDGIDGTVLSGRGP